MKTFKLERPPENPGVYILKNLKTLQVYVGCTANLRRRFIAWWSGASSKAAIPEHVLRIFKASPPDDWEFVVLETGTKQDRAYLLGVEEAAIRKLAGRCPDKLLNTQYAFGPSPPKRPKSGLPRAVGSGGPKTDLRDAEGRKVTYAEAAFVLNIKPGTLKKRLRRMRAGGVTEVAISDLT
jgi:hypothetical protein